MNRHQNNAFTLIELLVVIAIIAILAALLLPVIAIMKERARAVKARTEVQQIASAIQQFHAQYNRYPVSDAVMKIASSTKEDFTYGGTIISGGAASQAKDWKSGVLLTNDEVIAILLAMTNYPMGGLTINTNHEKNPQQTKFLTATMAGSTTEGGVGPDLVYRDPWGNPYIISLDLNYDEKCRDSVYRLKNVSQESNAKGFNGLFNSSGNPNSDYFEFNGGVMVWSAGPNRNFDAATANVSPNKDNILSWK